MAKKIEVQGLTIHLKPSQEVDYVSLTDIAKKSDRNEAKYLIRNWMKNNNTLEFLVAWEQLHNPDFGKGVQMDPFLRKLQQNSTILTPQKWVETTGAIGITSKPGRGGGTYAHKDIALEFCSWLSPSFKVFLIKAFQELVEQEHRRQSLKWHISKITDNIEEVRNLLDTIPFQAEDRNRLK